MVGTTRSRIIFFINRCRCLGFIGYDSHLTVKRSLLKVICTTYWLGARPGRGFANVRFGSEADLPLLTEHVRFAPEMS